MKTLVWITHSLRTESRLTSLLSDQCTFVYYSPYYFAGKLEKEILSTCSRENLDAFYFTLHQFEHELKSNGCDLHIFKESDPVQHINKLCKKYGFEQVIIDEPLFSMWTTVNVGLIEVPVTIIDSDLINDKTYKMTAKSRWITHIKKLDENKKLFSWNKSIKNFVIKEKSESYPKRGKILPLLDRKTILSRATRMSETYGETRDAHDGQTNVSVLLQNGRIDPHNLFYKLALHFKEKGYDLSKEKGPHAQMLRQFAFREINIRTARKHQLTMEHGPKEWAEKILHWKAFDNMMDHSVKDSKLTFAKIKSGNTGFPELDRLLKQLSETGHMPNRGRMYYASKLFYEAKTGLDALDMTLKTFNLIGLDGQSPNNYMQCVTSLSLTYGKVMNFSKKRTFELLNYKD